MAANPTTPGWYPDPEGGGDRWWNGVGWSDARRAAGAAAPIVVPTAAAAASVGSPSMSATEPAAAPVVYSASNPAPQYPGQQVQSIPRAAFTINARKNPSAGYALIAGLIAIFFNILLVPSVVAIVFGVRGLTRARQLAAEGEANTLRSTAVVGIVLGVTNLAFGVFQALVFIGAVSLSFFAG